MILDEAVTTRGARDADGGELVRALAHGRASLQAAVAAAQEGFPHAALDRLKAMGLLEATLPRRGGGLGWGREAGGMICLGRALQELGRASLALGRIYEAHVNAVALIARYGSEDLQRVAWADVRAGHLLALWVAPSALPLRVSIVGGRVDIAGLKPVCTAAGIASRAVVTAWDDEDRERLIYVDATRATPVPLDGPGLSGMRNTATAAMRFDMSVPAPGLIGEADDYLHEPDFSAGAWRTSAVTAGGLAELVDETIRQLASRARHRSPCQSARIGQLLIHAQTSRMWAAAAAAQAALADQSPADLTGLVGLARVAIEQACLDSIQLVQRSLGFASLTRANKVEAMMRDLAIYLRQPAGDEVLAEAAIHFAEAVSAAP